MRPNLFQLRGARARNAIPNPRDAKPFSRKWRPARPQTRAQRRLQFWLTSFCVACAGVILILLDLLHPQVRPAMIASLRDPVMDLPGPYRNCRAANAAGFYSIPASSPAYSPFQDRDGDGFACEPITGGGPEAGLGRIARQALAKPD